MRDIDNLLENKFKKNNVLLVGKCKILNGENDRVVLKEKNNVNVSEVYEYLNSRTFTYFPKLINQNSRYDLYEYIENVNEPDEQKAHDMMYLLGLLHSKTTFHQEMDIDEYKEIYEELSARINNSMIFYDSIMLRIEKEVFMSPYQYMIARNISKIYAAIKYAESELESWYEYIKSNPKKRMVLLHNNVDLDHVVRNKDLYLLSWDNSKRGIPIYDLYNFYKKYGIDFNFLELLNYYEEKYPLLKEEKQLLFILISIPEVIKIDKSEFEMMKRTKYVIDRIYKTDLFLNEIQNNQK